MNIEQLKALRNLESLRLFDTNTKYHVRIQYNPNEKFVCWKRYVSLDRKNWQLWNEFLSLKDIKNILTEIKDANRETREMAC